MDKKKIDVRGFIKSNYTPYDGDESFLQKPTQRTKVICRSREALLSEERKSGGVLDVDCKHISSLLSFPPGYINKDLEIIKGLQTDKPLKRAVNPFGGIRLSQKSCEEYGYTLDPQLVESFKYRTTHNDGVFRVYTDEMKKARHSGIITGLPDAYGRGRIIGDYRRVALYGMDFLIGQKKKDKERYGQAAHERREHQSLRGLVPPARVYGATEDYGGGVRRRHLPPRGNAREAVNGCITAIWVP